MATYIEAWQCIGCGRVEAPQACIGVCKDRKVALVPAAEHEECLERLAKAEHRAHQLAALARTLASTHPRPGQWQPSYEVFQRLAQELLKEQDGGAPLTARQPA